MAQSLLKYSLALLLCALFLAFVQSAPQLFENDQQGVSGERFQANDAIILDDDDSYTPVIRTRRGSHHGHGGGYGHQASATHNHGHGHGHGWGWPAVGPVFTYVRTDYHGNFQWGVRHRAGGGHGWSGR